MSTDLTHTPDAEDFRALARSAPWRFTTLHWTHRAHDDGPSGPVGEVEAWLNRPWDLTVRRGDRVWRESSPPYSTSAWKHRPMTPPTAAEPLRRPDGLVGRRPGQFGDVDYDDPMVDNFRWVAMLDPVELADGSSPGEHPDVQVEGVAVTEVSEVELRGRRTWQAVCRPLVGAYDPRCGCCPLLDSVASRLLEYGPDDPALATGRESLPTAYLVSLDVRTGIVADVSPRDGDGAGSSFGNEIHAVDEPLRPPAARAPAGP
ncbi:hypothetical protein AVL62_05005 [Serinicoccus chungangensis]|uniref:Uncharacterized protein n=1 Tax=Serinicoccus chungangensis TaxID=767452 RepID=A0A0W8I8H2_9MICO|nr:hypothetical protein [Serinicoccus chungangensis]KUG55664.1 hypothetical protein AVL62_05005 [Serinicoccus chungangensis]